MAWKRKGHEAKSYATFIKDDEDIRKMFLRLDDITFKRLQLYERKMKKKSTMEMFDLVDSLTTKNQEACVKMNQALYELAEECKTFDKRVETKLETGVDKDTFLTGCDQLRSRWDLKIYKDDVAGGEARRLEKQLTRNGQSDKLVAILFKEITGREY